LRAGACLRAWFGSRLARGLLLSWVLASLVHAEDSELRALGAAVFERGEIAAASSVTLGDAEIEVDAKLFACANCHGVDARGRIEGGVAAPQILWSHLHKPYPVLGGRFRWRPGYSEETFARALQQGLDPAEQALAWAMPRYRLQANEIAGLLAYLRALDAAAATTTTLSVGVRLPLASHPAAHQRNQAMRAVLEAYAAELEVRGGIYHRRIEWRFVELDQPFVEPVLVGLDLALDPANAAPRPDDAVPVIALFASAADSESSRYALYSGIETRAEALRQHAASLGMEVERSRTNHDAQRPPKTALLYEGSDAAVLASLLQAQPRDQSLLLTHWLESPALIELAARHSGAVHVAVPPTLELAGSNGRELFRRLGTLRPLPREHALAQLWTLAAARSLGAVLEEAGREVHSRRLSDILETWYRRDIGLGPALSFSSTRRIGAPGAVVLQLRQGRVEGWTWVELDQPPSPGFATPSTDQTPPESAPATGE
jgi:hypothetical protein